MFHRALKNMAFPGHKNHPANLGILWSFPSYATFLSEAMQQELGAMWGVPRRFAFCIADDFFVFWSSEIFLVIQRSHSQLLFVFFSGCFCRGIRLPVFSLGSWAQNHPSHWSISGFNLINHLFLGIDLGLIIFTVQVWGVEVSSESIVGDLSTLRAEVYHDNMQ